MKVLELKIPPVLVFIIFAGLMWWISSITRDAGMDIKFRMGCGLASFILGATIGISGVVSVKRAKTTLNPLRPQEASTLVCSGTYRHTRNPMYLALVFLLIFWICILDNLYASSGIFLFILYMNAFQIKPEEQILESMFGKSYESYKNRVRRWV